MSRQTLGDLQHAIMAVLWERGEATTADVHEALQAERGLALTTIATMLRKMEDKGVVAHRAEGRQYITYAWWLVTFPGVAIVIAVLGFNLTGDWLREVMDPKQKLR